MIDEGDIASLFAVVPETAWPLLLRLFEGEEEPAEPRLDRRDRLIREFRAAALADIASDRAASREIARFLNRAATGSRAAQKQVGGILKANAGKPLSASQLCAILAGKRTHHVDRFSDV